MNNQKILKTIQEENFIWIIYLVLIALCLYANGFEKKYYVKNDLYSKENYRKINILVFSIAVVIYYYFFIGSYKAVKNLKYFDSPQKKFLNEMNLLASTLILIAGSILLFIAIVDTNLDTEIAFT